MPQRTAPPVARTPIALKTTQWNTAPGYCFSQPQYGTAATDFNIIGMGTQAQNLWCPAAYIEVQLNHAPAKRIGNRSPESRVVARCHTFQGALS